MTWFAPCGHEGTPIFGNFVLCPKCDKKPTQFPTWAVVAPAAPSYIFEVIAFSAVGLALTLSETVEFELHSDGALQPVGQVELTIQWTGLLASVAGFRDGVEVWRTRVAPITVIQGQKMTITLRPNYMGVP